MDLFNIIAGTASIVSLVIALLAWRKVRDVEKKFNAQQNSKQGIANHSPVTQTMTGVNRG